MAESTTALARTESSHNIPSSPLTVLLFLVGSLYILYHLPGFLMLCWEDWWICTTRNMSEREAAIYYLTRKLAHILHAIDEWLAAVVGGADPDSLPDVGLGVEYQRGLREAAKRLIKKGKRKKITLLRIKREQAIMRKEMLALIVKLHATIEQAEKDVAAAKKTPLGNH